MIIQRDQPTTGTENRTPREEIRPLFTTQKVNPEQLIDCSQSQGFPWRTKPGMTTWQIQIPTIKAITYPFAELDSAAAAEAGTGAGGTEMWPFAHLHLPWSNKRDTEGELIIDAGPDNFDERFAYFMSLYPQIFQGGAPIAGGTEAMEAVNASDKHFLGEFGEGAEEVRARMLHTDGLLQDEAKFIKYLRNATLDPATGFGLHDKWREVWAVVIYGEAGGGGKDAYEQYQEIARDHPWVHPYYFEGVTNADEVAEDIAVATVPTQSS